MHQSFQFPTAFHRRLAKTAADKFDIDTGRSSGGNGNRTQPIAETGPEQGNTFHPSDVYLG